jgi:hypothetical protein
VDLELVDGTDFGKIRAGPGETVRLLEQRGGSVGVTGGWSQLDQLMVERDENGSVCRGRE